MQTRVMLGQLIDSLDLLFVPPAEQPEPESAVTEQPQPVAQGGHVLLVEDNRVNQMVAKKLLEKIGLDCLAITAEREVQLLKIYRNRDAARKLSDEGFKKVLAFTDQAFEMALHFAATQEQSSAQTDAEPAHPKAEGED